VLPHHPQHRGPIRAIGYGMNSSVYLSLREDDHGTLGPLRCIRKDSPWFNAPQGVSLLLTPRPGEVVAKVEGHNLTGSMPNEKTLRDIANSHVIAAPSSAAR
jgi:hypothetical protein